MKVESKQQHIDLLIKKMQQILSWRNPDGTIEKAYIPSWLAKECRNAIKGEYSRRDDIAREALEETKERERIRWESYDV